MNNIGKYEKSVAKSMLKKLLSLNLIDENEFRTLADNINLDIKKKKITNYRQQPSIVDTLENR